MKKAIIAVLVLGVAVTGVYLGIMAMRPEAKACGHIASLCGQAKEESNTCVSDMQEMKRTLAQDQFQRSMDCLEQAKSCAEVSGCRIGMGLRSLGNSVGDFLKGVSRSVGQPSQ